MAKRNTQEETVPETTADAPKKTRERKVLAPLDFSQLAVRTIHDADTMRAFKRTRGERDPEQQQIDALVRRAYEHWVATGKGETWTESRGLHIRVPVGQYDTIYTRALRAGAFFDMAIRFSDRKDADGYAEVVLVAKDKPVKAEDAPTEPEDADAAEDGLENDPETGEVADGDQDAEAVA